MFHCKFWKKKFFLSTCQSLLHELFPLPVLDLPTSYKWVNRMFIQKHYASVALQYLQKEVWKSKQWLRFVQDKTPSFSSPSLWCLLAWVVCSGNGLLAKWVFEVWLFHGFLYLLVVESNGLLRIAACLKKIWSSAKTLFSDPYILGKNLWRASKHVFLAYTYLHFIPS